MAWGDKGTGRTFKPFVSIDDPDIQLRGVVRKGSYWYMKYAKRGSWMSSDHLIGSVTGKGPKSGTVNGSRYWVDWEED